jgi:hypothetical protein
VISHIGECNFSTIAPKITTLAPMKSDCKNDKPLVKNKSPRKYERLVSKIAVIKLLK